MKQKDTLNVDKKISEILSRENRDKIAKTFRKLNTYPDEINQNQMLKCFKHMFPKEEVNNLPSAKYNHFGVLVSTENELKELLTKEFTERLRTSPL